jgi:hypothetical protein
MKESIQRAFAFLNGHKVPMGIGQQVDTTDFHVEAIDLLGNRVPCEAGIGLIVAVYSAIKRHPALPALVVLGDLSIQGNIKPVQSLAEPLQVAMDNGARRALIPLENKRSFLDVARDTGDGACVAASAVAPCPSAGRIPEAWGNSSDGLAGQQATHQGPPDWTRNQARGRRAPVDPRSHRGLGRAKRPAVRQVRAVGSHPSWRPPVAVRQAIRRFPS